MSAVAIEVLSSSRLVMVCGGGGVGKTTTSAAIGLCLAQKGKRVLVITVDPAKRLADALGISSIEFTETSVPIDGAGTLAISMLDTKQGWDDLIRRHSTDAVSAERIINNVLYSNITSRFVNSHDYIAMERLHELGSDSRFDVVVVDTPPSRNALDLLDAPARMREFFEGRLLRWLTLPYRSRALNIASKPFLNIADRLLGSQFLTDIAEFFTLLQSMEKGFIQRANDVEKTLRSGLTQCVVVTSAQEASGAETVFLLDELKKRSISAALVVVNRISVIKSSSTNFPSIAVDTSALDTKSLARVMSAMRLAEIGVADAVERQAAVISQIYKFGIPLVTVPNVTKSGSSPDVSRAATGLSAIATALTAV